MSRLSQSPLPPTARGKLQNPSIQERLAQRPLLASAGLHLLVLGSLVGWIPFVPHAARGTDQPSARRRSTPLGIPFEEPLEALEFTERPSEELPPLAEDPSQDLDPSQALDALVFPETEPRFPAEDPAPPVPRDLDQSPAKNPFAEVTPHLSLTPQPTPPTSEPIPELSRGQETNLAAPTEIPGDCEAPRYPDWAARSKISAEVRLAITVGTDGRVRAVEIISSLGHRTLIENAARAVWSWRYHPAQENGQPVEDVVHKTIRYVP